MRRGTMSRKPAASAVAVLFVAGMLGLAGCGDGSTTAVADGGITDDGGGADDGGTPLPFPFDEVTVTWEPCSLYEGANDGLAECATVAMPLVWDNPDGRTFDVRAKRLLSASGAGDVALWLLAGGPGQAGTYAYPEYMEDLQALRPGLDLYTLDHRGTGFSGRLSCPDQESPISSQGESITNGEMPACLEYLQAEHGDALDAFTTTQSAIDVGALIHLTREPGQRIMVRGTSYGSYWVHRYLQLFPDQADGAILEAIFPSDDTFINHDEHTNQVAHDVMDVCGADAVCAEKLGSDPWAFLGDVLDRMDEGHCVNFTIKRDLVRVLFAYVLYSRALIPVFPAATYRLSRCDEADRSAIVNLVNFMFGDGGLWDLDSYSILLQHHVTFSEMWAHPAFADVDLDAYFADLYDNAYVLKNLGPQKKALRETWPLYSDEAWDDGWAETTTPMLMLQGVLDPATPHAKAIALKDHFTAPHQHFISFPQGAHGVLGSSRLADGTDCARSILFAFLDDPQAELDQSCVDDIVPLDFTGTESLALAVFGTTDLWENPPAAAPAPSPTLVAAHQAALRRTLRAMIATQ